LTLPISTAPGHEPADWQRPQLDQADPKISVRADATWQAIVAHGEHVHPERKVYLLGDRLVRVSKDDEGQPKLVPWDATSLTDHIDRVVDCGTWKPVKGSDPPEYQFVIERTPTDLARNLLGRTPDMLPRAPRIARIVDVPVMGRDRKLMFEPGYHASAQTYYEPAEGLDALAVAGRNWASADEIDVADYMAGWTTQQQDVAEAREFLLDVLKDFPFADQASYAHALCMMVEPFARELIGNKPTPMYAVRADAPNTGKSLLTQACLYPGCGERFGTMTYTRDADSLRKLLTSTLIGGGPAVWLDNIPKGDVMDSAVLAAALTAHGGRWDDRILGHSKMASVPIRNVWVMTANKPQVSDELARRMIPIRLLSPRPDDYPFRLPLDAGWLEENRAAMVSACLTLVLNYTEGSELMEQPEAASGIALGTASTRRIRRSYRAWSQVMGGIMQAAGLGDYFLGNLDEWEQEAAVEIQDDAAFLRQWHERQVPPLRIRELASLIRGYALPDHGLPMTSDPIELPLSLNLKQYRDLEDALKYWLRPKPEAGGYRVVAIGNDSPYRWSVEKVG
jgi:hypothetical protein